MTNYEQLREDLESLNTELETWKRTQSTGFTI